MLVECFVSLKYYQRMGHVRVMLGDMSDWHESKRSAREALQRSKTANAAAINGGPYLQTHMAMRESLSQISNVLDQYVSTKDPWPYN